ncbi:hypothetical protein [Clostridium botulinum]|uniref:hypothetical protein n=1 Tax=Clostridium botulinum TaxID=1491 RepID=UPI001F418C2B|nr:hypothetical protein [Clostridium botulinum]
MKTSNELLKEIIEEQLEILVDKSNKILKGLYIKLDKVYKVHIERIGTETEKKIQALNELQKEAENRYESYYNRKTIIDYLIYINLAITPILFFIIIYIQFFKK